LQPIAINSGGTWRDKSAHYKPQSSDKKVKMIDSVHAYLRPCTEPFHLSMVFSQTGEGPSNTLTTPRKSPRKRLGLKKKLTPKKEKNMDV
jgi:hypothetical protein